MGIPTSNLFAETINVAQPESEALGYGEHYAEAVDVLGSNA